MNRMFRAAALTAALAAVGPWTAHAEPSAPVTVPACTVDLDGTMTLLPDARTYAVCSQTPGGYAWSDAATPFEPNDSWLSYGPVITLHGQGMRNPNLTGGQWTALPRDPETTCRAQQTTVVEAGVLAAPVVTEGEQGKPLNLQLLPKLFYLELSGNCLWQKV